MKFFLMGLTVGLIASTAWAQSYDVHPFAGGGLPPLPASALAISIGDQFTTAASDSAGNLYVTDEIAQVIYKVSGGSVTRFAGTGNAGYSGDGGPAIAAQINSPRSVIVDQTGAVYFADVGNSRIRKIANGMISTVAGNGTPGFSGDGGLAINAEIGASAFLTIGFDSNGNLYINEFSRIRKVTSDGIINTIAGGDVSGDSGDGGPALSARIASYAVTADSSGNVYFADNTDNIVRKISNAGIISTIAGNHTPGFSGDGGPALTAQLHGPQGIAVDGSGNLYVADADNQRIRKISAAGTISTYAGIGIAAYTGDGGPANNATLNYPNTVNVDPAGNIIISDSGNRRIRQVSVAGVISTVAGNGFINEAGDGGAAITAQFRFPAAVSVTSSGIVYIGDGGNYTVRQVSSSGVVTRVAGNGSYGYSGDGGPATNAQLANPAGVASDETGNLYISDADNNVVRKVAPDGNIVTYAGDGIFGYSGDGQSATSASLANPEGLAVDSVGNLYIADTSNCVVRKVDLGLTISTVAGTGTCGFGGDGGPAVAALLRQPRGVAVDGEANLFIAESANSRIREVSAATGVITTIAGNGQYGNGGDGGPAVGAQLENPSGVAVDGGGNVFISDAGTNTVRKISTGGIISTIAGTGEYGYSGDNGPAYNAEFSAIQAIAATSNGTVYVADTYNNAVRELNMCPVSIGAVTADSNAQTLGSPLTAASTCEWAASNLPTWITSASSGTGSGTLSLTFQANTTGMDRSATITVNGLPVTVSQAFTAAQFQDVPPGAYYFDAVNLLKDKMITAGCGPGDYCPTGLVTRAQMAIFIVRTVLGGDNFTYSPTPHFTDVQPADFGFAWIQKLYELGITAGCGPALYCPNNSVTRDQMAVFIIRARYGAGTVFDYPPTPYFADVPASDFGFTYVQRMKEDNITAGCSATTYCPNNPVTRGDMAIFVMRGGFNQLLPATEATIVSVSPAVIANGVATPVTITGAQTHFSAGTVLNAVPGLTASGVTVVNATTLTATVTGNAATTPQPISIWVTDATEEAVLPNGLSIQ